MSEKEEIVEEMTLDESEATQDDTMQVAEDMTALMSEFETRYKRLQADFDNFRKRTQTEKEQISGYVKGEMISDLLPIVDNFERALSTEATAETEAYMKGFQMIYDLLMHTLKEQGLEEIKALGEEFDPNYHQAVLNGPDDNYADNQICAVLQKGYMVDQRVIRPAMVKVTQN